MAASRCFGMRDNSAVLNSCRQRPPLRSTATRTKQTVSLNLILLSSDELRGATSLREPDGGRVWPDLSRDRDPRAHPVAGPLSPVDPRVASCDLVASACGGHAAPATSSSSLPRPRTSENSPSSDQQQLRCPHPRDPDAPRRRHKAPAGKNPRRHPARQSREERDQRSSRLNQQNLRRADSGRMASVACFSQISIM